VENMKTRARIGALLTAVVLGLGLAVAASSPAFAGDYPHRLLHGSTTETLCLEVPGGDMNFGTQLTLGICGPQPTYYQIWVFTDQGSPHLYFVRPGHDWYCIQPGVGSLFRSTIVQVPCNWNVYQMWTLEPVSFGSQFFRLQNAGSLMCLVAEEHYIGEYVRQSNNCATGDLGGGQAQWRLG
jgi:hypothetical protein